MVRRHVVAHVESARNALSRVGNQTADVVSERPENRFGRRFGQFAGIGSPPVAERGGRPAPIAGNGEAEVGLRRLDGVEEREPDAVECGGVGDGAEASGKMQTICEPAVGFPSTAPSSGCPRFAEFATAFPPPRLISTRPFATRY